MGFYVNYVYKPLKPELKNEQKTTNSQTFRFSKPK